MPAAGLSLQLFALDCRGDRDDRGGGDTRELLVTETTNSDGRVDAPLLEGPAMRTGRYEILFAAGDYLRANGLQPEDPGFLDEIPIRFAIARPEDHLHVPLLLSPFGYSTYRGS